MSDRIKGRIFIFSKERTEKTLSMLDSRVNGMLNIGLNSILPMTPFNKKGFPWKTVKSILNMIFFIVFSHTLVGFEWLTQCLKKDRPTFQRIFIKCVGIKELKFESEHEDSELEYNCLCTYIKIKGRLIGVIHYGYKTNKK
jgi:hypothetical protein